MTSISVVVIGYRNEDTIVRAVESLLAQNDEGLAEIIVVTSGGDRSAQRVRDACPSVLIIERSERLFPGGACNLGINVARSDVVAFLPADCVAEAGWISTRVELHGLKRRAVASAITKGGRNSPAAWASHYLLFCSRLSGRRAGSVIPPDPAVHGHSVPRQMLLATGGFREDLRIGEDTILAIRLHRLGVEIFFDPRVRTAHFEPTATIPMLIDQFRRGRRRTRGGRAWRAPLALVLRLPRDIVIRLVWVVVQGWRNAAGDRWLILLILPWLAAGAAANCLGALFEQVRTTLVRRNVVRDRPETVPSPIDGR